MPPPGWKVLPGEWFREPEFARSAAALISQPPVSSCIFDWHAPCKVACEPRAWESLRTRTGEPRMGVRFSPGGAKPMENAVLIGLSRQIALHRELEVVANNIANLDTTGYKSDGAVFHEYLM